MDKPEIKNYHGDVICSEKFDYTAMTECNAEVTMPDYYPEIRKVVSVFAQELPDSKYLSDGKLEYGGTVSFSVLYVGDDGSLCCVPYSGEYSDSVQLPTQVEGSNSVRITAKAENAQCRVTAPRKITLKSRIKTQIIYDARENYSCSVKTASGELYNGSSLEYLDKTADTVFRRWGNATGSCSGEISAAAGSKPVMCSGSINILSAAAGRDSVSVKGDAAVKCIVFGSDGVYSTVCGNIPFEETVSMEGVSEGDTVCACGRAASVGVSTEAGTAAADVEYDLDITVCRPSKICINDDVYSTRTELELSRGQWEPISLIACANGRLTAVGEIEKSPQRGGDGYIISADAQPCFEKAEMKEGKLVLSGNMKVKTFTACDGDVVCEEGTLPLKYELPAECDAATQEVLWNCDAAVIGISAKEVGEKISISAELCLSVDAVRKYKITPVTEACLGAEEFSGGEGYVVKICCPEKGSTVWEIAKRHHAQMSELERINGVQRDGVSDGSPIIIK